MLMAAFIILSAAGTLAGLPVPAYAGTGTRLLKNEGPTNDSPNGNPNGKLYYRYISILYIYMYDIYEALRTAVSPLKSMTYSRTPA